MPELPEVETVRRGLETALKTPAQIAKVDQRRKDLRVPFPKNLKKRLEGHEITRFGRRAKYLLIYMSSGEVMILHLGMSGSILITKGHRPEKHDHLILTLKNGQQIVFNDPRRFGMVYLCPEEDLETHKAFANIGPEPLGNDFNGPVLAEKLKGKTTSVKQALLDQRVVAGVGNIYACEALFEAGISPKRKAKTIQGQRAEKLVNAIRGVLKRAIKAGGSSLKDHKQVSGELGYFQHNFKVYDCEGENCLGCDCDIAQTNGIKRMIQSGRSTFYCPRKQK